MMESKREKWWTPLGVTLYCVQSHFGHVAAIKSDFMPARMSESKPFEARFIPFDTGCPRGDAITGVARSSIPLRT